MKKQITAVLSAMAMLSSSFVAMASSDSISVTLDPTTGRTTLNLMNEKGSKSSVQGSTKISGEKALHVLESGGGAITYLTVGVGAGDIIDFWAKGFEAYPDFVMVDNNFNVWTKPWKGTSSIHNNNKLGIDRYMEALNDTSGAVYDVTQLPVELLESKADGWKHWRTRPETFSKQGTSNLRFTDETAAGQTANGGGYIDDVIVYKADGTIRNITNFEDAYDVENSADGHHVYGLSANGAEDSIILSWRNPARDDIAKIEVYEVAEDGSETLVDGSVSCTSGALNTVTVDAEELEEKEFNVKLTLADGEEYVSNVKGMATDHYMYFTDTAEGEALNGWQYTDIDAPYSSVHYDEVAKAAGGRSLRIDFNSNDVAKKVVLTNTDTVLDSGSYLVRAKTKFATTTAQESWGAFNMMFDVIEDGSTLDIEIPCRSNMTTLWVDDIEIFAYDPDEGIIGDDLCVNGSFESGFTPDVSYSVDVNLAPIYGTAILNLKNEKGSLSSIQSKEVGSGEKALNARGSGGGFISDINLGIPKGGSVEFWAKGGFNTEVSGSDSIQYISNMSISEPYAILADGTTHKFSSARLGTREYFRCVNEYSKLAGATINWENLPVKLLETREDGWMHWITTPKLFASSGMQYLRFVSERKDSSGNYAEGSYIDDIITRDANGVVLNYTNFEDAYEVEGSKKGSHVYGLSANGADNSIILSWSNPARDDISNISIYEVNADGSETLLKADSDCTSNAICTYTVAADKYEEKAFKVKLTLSDKTVYSSYVEGQATNKFMYTDKTAEGDKLNGWSISATNGLYASVHYDNTSKAVGERSLRIDLNSYDAAQAIKVTNNELALDKGTYLVQVKTRKTASNGPEAWGISTFIIEAENDGTNLNINIPCRNNMNTLWIDDIEIYDYNTGKKSGENLCVNGSFEKGYFEKTDSVASGLYSNGTAVKALNSGSFEAKTIIENNTDYDSITAVTFAVLKKDGKIQKIWMSDSVSADKGQNVTAAVDVVIPDLSNGAYELSVYSWNSADGIIPLIPANTIAE